MTIFAWFLPVISGIADTASRSAIKLTNIHRLTLVAGGFFFALPYYLIWLLITGLPQINPKFWVVMAIEVPLLTIANIMIVEAHRRSPLMVTIPLQAFLPILLLVTTPLMGLLLYPSPLTVGWPSILGAVGVLIATIGLYFLNYQKNQKGLLAPFKQLTADPGLRFICGVLLFFSITANLDLLGFSYSNAPFFLLVVHGLTGLTALLTLFIYVWLGKMTENKTFSPRVIKTLALYGFFIALSVIPHILAFKWIVFVPYVITGKRIGMVISAVIVALFLAAWKKFKGKYADERENLSYRLAGIVLMLAGMITVILFG